MANFNGSNTTVSPWEIFYFRGLYRQDAIPSVETKQQIRDLSFAEDTLYGRVDTRLNTVYPKQEKMKIITSEDRAENSFRLLDFAADAFENVRRAMTSARDNGIIPNNSVIFSDFKIKKAYQSPDSLYNQYIDNLMNKYVFEHLAEKNNKKSVLKINDFIKHFILFLKDQPGHNPVTFTSWQRSTTSNIFTSGIAIDIAGLEYGEDPLIEQRVLQNPCFPYYLNVCKANGFLVSQLSPTLMVADILSPGLEPYAKQNSVYSTEEIFLNHYNYTYAVDYEILQSKFVDGYNLLVANFPIEKKTHLKCRQSFVSKIIERFPITTLQSQEAVSSSEWLMTYVKIRNIEERGALSEQMFNKLIKRIKTTKYVDNFQAMRYINNTFRDTYKSKYGGLNYFIHREEERNKDTEPSTESTSGASKINNGGSSGGY